MIRRLGVGREAQGVIIFLDQGQASWMAIGRYEGWKSIFEEGSEILKPTQR